MRGLHSNFHGSFFTILDNVLTVGESAKDEERADQPHPHPGGLLGGVGGGAQEIVQRRTSPELSGGDTSAVRSMSRSKRAHLENLEIQIFTTITVFFI